MIRAVSETLQKTLGSYHSSRENWIEKKIMRSSKNRSRNKNNRNRPSGNIVNRVFDSSGPEGKVRGTPQQIIEKYNQLARDAQLSNDPVATENFQQHAEHYTRLLGEAQREQDARRAEQEAQQRQAREARQAKEEAAAAAAAEATPEVASDLPGTGDQPGLSEPIETSADSNSGLVETPEAAPKPKRTRTRRAPRKPAAETAKSEAPEAGSEDTQAAE